jgi:hypothetical protein
LQSFAAAACPHPLVSSPIYHPSVSQTMSEPVPDSKPETMPEPAEDPWRVAFVEFKTRDEKMVKDYQEEIDTLLVFVRHPHHVFIIRLIILVLQAGLFSAVLTAFVVESYQSLQEDYTKTSVDLLRQISQQLANSSLPAAPNSSQFQVQRSDVRVNVCWFVSLLLSLVVALFGIFLKQWMRSYIKWTDVTPDQEAVAVRQFRYRSLETWRIAAILALLPTLLQLSVIVFLSGLLVFLSSLDRTVAIVMIVLTSIAFFLVAAVTFVPVLSWTCPYRAPLSEVVALSLWRVTGWLKLIGRVVLLFIPSYSAILMSDDALSRAIDLQVDEWSDHWRHWLDTPQPTSWVQADQGATARYNNNRKHHAVSMHVSAMVQLCCTTQSQPLWSAALTAIAAAQYPLDSPVPVSGSTDIFYNEVWGPVFEHIYLLTEPENKWNVRFSYHRRLFQRAFSQSTRFSSSMKQCWADFVMHSKKFISQSDTRFASSYMICCLASIEPTSGGLYMRAFMEVLEAQHMNLQERQLGCVAWCLNESMGPLKTSVLLESLSGLSFPDKIIT